MSRLSLLTNSLKSPNTNTIKTAFDDVFHQNIRLKNYPKLTKLLNKIPEIGGLGSFLCGSGPTIAGITTDNPMSFFYEVADYCDKQNIEAKLLITSFTSKGAYIKN
jgi:homoserine kinase